MGFKAIRLEFELDNDANAQQLEKLITHVRLGERVTSVVQSSRGTRRDHVNKIEDLPGLYSQMVRSLLGGTQLTNESGAVTRKNVTKAQNQPERVRADAIWYAKLGYGATTADGFDSGPEFGFGRRWELDRVGIDLAFFNFLMYQNSDGFKGLSAGWVELGADYFFDASANSTPYLGWASAWARFRLSAARLTMAATRCAHAGLRMPANGP